MKPSLFLGSHSHYDFINRQETENNHPLDTCLLMHKK